MVVTFYYYYLFQFNLFFRDIWDKIIIVYYYTNNPLNTQLFASAKDI